jgi:hypothetical protein
MSEPASQPTPGEAYRTLWETLNRRLAALGIFSRSRYDLSPRLNSEDWERLVTLAELGKERQQ